MQAAAQKVTQARIICEEFEYVGDWVPYDTHDAMVLLDRGVKNLAEAYGVEHKIETR